jgi:hypothetical protein
MSSSFKFHSAVPEIIPWQAQYNFPSQSNKVRKQTVKLVPKNGYSFTQNQIVRFEFPADGYCNMLNTALSFDVNTNILGPALTVPSGAVTNGTGVTAISTALVNNSNNNPFIKLPRGGAHNYFKRVRVLYGSLVLEDIQEYKTLARMFTEMGVEKAYQASTGGILDGHSESAMRNVGCPFTNPGPNQLNITETTLNMTSNALVDNLLAEQIQVGGVMGYGTFTETGLTNPTTSAAITGISPIFTDIASNGSAASFSGTPGTTTNTNVTRTFTIQLLTGLTSLKKLLPLKWMASQLVIELTIAPVTEAYVSNLYVQPTMTLQNMNMVTELLEFDSSYDLAFFEGLNQPTGVPLKFTSWHYHQFAITGATQTYQIHERSRSVKSAFAVIRQLTPQLPFDADYFFHNINDSYAVSLVQSTLATLTTTFTGGSSPSIAARTVTGNVNTISFNRGTDMGAVSAANITNNTNYYQSLYINGCAPVQQYQWRIGGQYYPAQPVRVCQTLGANLNNAIARGEEAYLELMKAVNSLGDATVSGGIHFWNYTITGTNGVNGEGSKFIMGTSFETPGLGPESINGINAEEQSDLALTIYGNQGGAIGTSVTNAKKLEVFVNYDCMLLVRAGNVVDLVL